MSLHPVWPKRILIVEDDRGLVETLSDRLTREGYTVAHEGDGEAALVRAQAEPFDLVLLDVMLPRLGGFDVCHRLREQGLRTPVILLSACGRVIDKVLGFKLGADDFVTKPFEMVELLARIEARLRPAARHAAGRTNGRDTYTFGTVRLDVRRAEVWRDRQPVTLSAREFRLLRYFVEHRGATLSRDELLNEVWGYNAIPTTRTVDVHVAWLRRKIESNPRRPQHLLTVHGLGYKFVG